METQAEQLMFENISKNMSDVDEYPAMMQERIINQFTHSMF
jgi:glutamate decarboxylase